MNERSRLPFTEGLSLPSDVGKTDIAQESLTVWMLRSRLDQAVGFLREFCPYPESHRKCDYDECRDRRIGDFLLMADNVRPVDESTPDLDRALRETPIGELKRDTEVLNLTAAGLPIDTDYDALLGRSDDDAPADDPKAVGTPYFDARRAIEDALVKVGLCDWSKRNPFSFAVVALEAIDYAGLVQRQADSAGTDSVLVDVKQVLLRLVAPCPQCHTLGRKADCSALIHHLPNEAYTDIRRLLVRTEGVSGNETEPS